MKIMVLMKRFSKLTNNEIYEYTNLVKLINKSRREKITTIPIDLHNYQILQSNSIRNRKIW